MSLILLPNAPENGLERHYTRALTTAVELYIVSAYLTEWDAPTPLNTACKTFRLIVGKDFGVTRKAACRSVMKWLPARLKNRFMVAVKIDGFHPKAMFWRGGDGGLHGLIGSSNLTRAAFSTNHEANIYLRLSKNQFAEARKWVEAIEPDCIPVSEDWLALYQEAPRGGPKGPSEKTSTQELFESLQLPSPRGAAEIVRQRQAQLASYRAHRAGLMKLFEDSAGGRISNAEFYKALPRHWSWSLGDRLQGAGWERQGKGSDFRKLSQSFLRIVEASKTRRDDVVAEEIDWLHKNKVRSRTAFLSEMLCLRFPELYPVKNQPIEDFLAAIKFKGPRGATEGAYYVDLAQRMRMSLQVNADHPAKTIAELDAVVWLVYGNKPA